MGARGGEQIDWLFDYLLFLVLFIFGFVGALPFLLLKRRGPYHKKYRGGKSEFFWTLLSGAVLGLIGAPSLLFLFSREAQGGEGLTLKASGSPWFGGYEYRELGLSFDRPLGLIEREGQGFALVPLEEVPPAEIWGPFVVLGATGALGALGRLAESMNEPRPRFWLGSAEGDGPLTWTDYHKFVKEFHRELPLASDTLGAFSREDREDGREGWRALVSFTYPAEGKQDIWDILNWALTFTFHRGGVYRFYQHEVEEGWHEGFGQDQVVEKALSPDALYRGGTPPLPFHLPFGKGVVSVFFYGGAVALLAAGAGGGPF